MNLMEIRVKFDLFNSATKAYVRDHCGVICIAEDCGLGAGGAYLSAYWLICLILMSVSI